MKYHFVRIPVMDEGSLADELNRFCNGRRIVQVDKHFVADGERSFWALCVSYFDGQAKGYPASKSRIDYREVLDDNDFAMFAKLRAVRKSLAESEGIPAYSVFTNEQLAALVTNKVRSKTAMSQIDGIGTSRINKYAQAMLAILTQEDGTDNAPAED